VFIPSKGRADKQFAAKWLEKSRVPFRVVVEPGDFDSYRWVVGEDRVLVLPDSNRGLVFARNWIKEHAISEGHERHWQFDDDVMQLMRLHASERLPLDAGVGLRMLEDFADRFTNVRLASFNSEFFVPVRGSTVHAVPPYYRNARCYTCFLISSDDLRFRGRYNEDTDMSLQVLAGGWCTVLFNAVMIRTPATMTSTGGQTDIYVGDGRLAMARELERRWPYVVETYRRFGRPQHKVRYWWKHFDTPLERRPDVVIPEGDTYGLQLVAVKDEVPERLQAVIDAQASREQ